MEAVPEWGCLRSTIVSKTVNHKLDRCSGVSHEDEIIMLRVGVEEVKQSLSDRVNTVCAQPGRRRIGMRISEELAGEIF